MNSPSPLARRWQTRSLAALLCFWLLSVVLPQVLGLGDAWKAFGAGLVLPGSALLYAIPAAGHTVDTTMVIGHAVILAVEIGVTAWALRRYRIVGAALVPVYALVILGCLYAPYTTVVVGHVAAFLGVLAGCFWAFGIRLIARADSVTLVAIIVTAAVAGALLTTARGHHAGPMVWIPWAALAVALGVTVMSLVRVRLARNAARKLGRQRLQYLEQCARPSARADAVGLQEVSSVRVSEASPQHLRLLRHLLGVALQPSDQWAGFDDEAAGPLQQYRYQVNALGWALAMFNTAHTPAYVGVLTDAQLALFDRAQQKAVWRYWYWQNLLGNWDFVKRRADPIDVPQNIMFTGYLNLQLAMYRRATGDARFDSAESLVFDWSPRQRFAFDHQMINAISIRNFDRDLYLWPCEPVLGPGRRRGYVFPYCNTVTAAGIAIMDTVNGTDHATDITRRITEVLNAEYTLAANDLAAFMVSGIGLSVRRVMSGPGSTAGVAAFIAPLEPDIAWRAWQVLKREWLETELYRVPASTGQEMPDWASGAKTNAETLAAAMHLARTIGDDQWHSALWEAATEQLRFTTDPANPGVGYFAAGSVHANAMLAFASVGHAGAFSDMMTTPRPAEWTNGPRLRDAPHPDVLVAKAVSDGQGLDLTVHPGRGGGRVALHLDQLRPGQPYRVHGALNDLVTADELGNAHITIDLDSRTRLAVRPL